MQQVSAEKWKNYVLHVLEEEDSMKKMYHIIDDVVDSMKPVVVDLGEDTTRSDGTISADEDDLEYPDIMARDGTYSGYFTQFTGHGRYSVMAYVYGNNKTSHAFRTPGFPPDDNIIVWEGDGPLPPSGPIIEAPANYTFKDTLLGDKEPTLPFQRVTGGTHFKVIGDLRQSDVPPGRISDFRAVEGHVENDGTPIVRLTWTWPGAHMTQGKAAEVEIRGGPNKGNLEGDFDSNERISNVVKGNLDPLPAGSKHDVTVALPRNWETTTHGDRDFKLKAYLAARVINGDGLKAKLSRIVSAEFNSLNSNDKSLTTGAATTKPGPALEKPHKQTGPATTSAPLTKEQPGVDPAAKTTAEAGHASNDDNSSVIIWILLALVAGVVVISITIMLLLRANSSTIAENEGAATNTVTTTTM
ncbi:hypothetical protein HPB49_005004 [Dermacentor silvarum]|uniref:Uncharacterized protein n=1 Tax=Dermacentor silvarum TaxID=543639 RepID=A0ACB8DMZ8_DERSI|nr:hypothetical protein HPB49_005004 [Dermacentor silvarum]